MTNLDKTFDPSGPFTLHILTFYNMSDKMWSAYCLDFNLVEDGLSRDQAVHRLIETIDCYLTEAVRQKLTLRELNARAPQFYWDMLEKATVESIHNDVAAGSCLPPYMIFKSKPINAIAAA